MYHISRGVQHGAQKIVLYGPEGIGKSTIASQTPSPVFIDTEGSTKKLDVARYPKPTSWTMLLDEVLDFRDHPQGQTLVIDTFDWAEKLAISHICSKANKTGIEDYGYGKGYTYLAEEVGRLLNLLEEVIERGHHVFITAHAAMRKFEQPDELGAYDRWELKLTKQVSPMLKEWADAVLFANYRTFVVKNEAKKNRAQGGERVLYTTHNPCWDAKNRDQLPDLLPLSFDSISCLFGTQQVPPPSAQTAPAAETFDPNDYEEVLESTEEPLVLPPAAKPLADLMERDHVMENELRYAVSQCGYFPEATPVANYPDDFIGYLVSVWPKVLEMIQDNRKLPFDLNQ